MSLAARLLSGRQPQLPQNYRVETKPANMFFRFSVLVIVICVMLSLATFIYLRPVNAATLVLQTQGSELAFHAALAECEQFFQSFEFETRVEYHADGALLRVNDWRYQDRAHEILASYLPVIASRWPAIKPRELRKLAPWPQLPHCIGLGVGIGLLVVLIAWLPRRRWWWKVAFTQEFAVEVIEEPADPEPAESPLKFEGLGEELSRWQPSISVNSELFRALGLASAAWLAVIALALHWADRLPGPPELAGMVVLALLGTGLLGVMLLLYCARMLPGRALVWHEDGMRTRAVGGETAHHQDGLSALQRDEGVWLTVLSPLGAQRFRCTSSEAADLQGRFADAGYDPSHDCFALRKERGAIWYCIALFAFLLLWMFLPVNAVTSPRCWAFLRLALP